LLIGTEERFISRKVIGFPLQVRPENFVGVGQQNFSKTNIDEAQASPKTQDTKASSEKSQSAASNKPNFKLNRYAVHAVAILAIIGIAGIGRINASEALSIRGSGSTKDQTSMITTGAILATSTQSLIAEDVSKKARDLTNMSSLSTSGDDFLTNKSSVLAAGSPSRAIISYKVKQGDTLSSLSAKFGITTDTIKWANDISDENSIKPDASLTILPVNGILYTSQAGDDILALADRYQSNASLIESFNGLDGKAPEAGMQLVIPDGVKPAPAPSYVNRVASTSSGSGFYSNSRFSGNGNSYYWGQCTWYVASRRAVPNNWGNAISWYYNAQYAGYNTGRAPRAGAIGWEFKNHVVYVESVNDDGTVNISEMNYGGRPGVRHDRTVPASTFLYIY
jgi:surface antigen